MKKELSMEARLLIAFVLMGLVLFLTRYIPTSPATGADKALAAKATDAKTTDVKEAPTPPKEAAAPPLPVAPAVAEMPGQVHSDKEETVEVDTKVYHVVFSNKGAVVKSWVLKDFKGHDGLPLDLVNAAAQGRVPAPFSVDYKNYLRPTSSFSPLASDKHVISSLYPRSATPAGPDFQLTVDGSGFAVSSQVVWNGTALSTRIDKVKNDKGQEIGDNEHRLFASVPASLVALAGIANIAVLSPDGAYSNTFAYAIDPNNGRYKVDRDGDNLTFEFSDGRLDVKKTFEFGKESYLSHVTSQVSQNGVMLPHELEWRGGFGDESIANPAVAQHALLYDPGAPRSYGIFNNELQAKDVSVAKNGPVTSSGQYTFAGIEDGYFAAVFLPSGTSLKLTTLSDQVPKDGKDVAYVGAAVGGEGLNSLDLYVGPKDLEILKRVNPKLELVIAWGKFEIIAKPLFEVLKWTAGKVGGDWRYGWAIILVTIAINTLLFPLKITSMKSSKKMQAIQPQITAINAKYKGLSLNDPKKADQNAEIMALYKENGVNPAGGCLPMLLQLPFFFAFYAVLGVAIQLRGAHWMWVNDLSQQESLAIHVLPVILVITQFLTQKMTPSPGVDPTQQKMMMVMPLVMGYMFYFQMSGLVIYWLTGNVVGIAQQWFLNRGTPKPSPKVVDVKPVPKKKK